MFPRFRRSCILLGSLTPIVALAACTAGHTSAAPSPVSVPRPDLCKVLDRKTVGAALLGKVKGCVLDGGADYYSVQFTGTAVVQHHKTLASLTVGYTTRYEPKTGLDRWAAFAQPQGDRVSLIGVGDMAVFDAKAAPAPQLMAVSKNLILTIALKTGKVAVPQERLPDHLLAVANGALGALPR
jgi:hypothetical protein